VVAEISKIPEDCTQFISFFFDLAADEVLAMETRLPLTAVV